jgi:hypothetical protein
VTVAELGLEARKRGIEIDGLGTCPGKTASARRSLAARRMTAILAVFATLFQATLFGWHHHSLSLSSRNVATVAVSAAAGLGLPAAVDHDCEICFAIGRYHGAIPIDPFGMTPVERALLQDSRLEAVVTCIAAYLLFHSRAPPLA